MEYKGVRYVIRVGIERDQWCIAIHKAGNELQEKRVSGTREDAQFYARSMIDRWLQKYPATHREQSSQNMPAHDPDADLT